MRFFFLFVFSDKFWYQVHSKFTKWALVCSSVTRNRSDKPGLAGGCAELGASEWLSNQGPWALGKYLGLLQWGEGGAELGCKI